MAYCTRQDLLERVSEEELRQLIIDDDTDMTDQEIEDAVEAGAINAIAGAGELIDGYCAGRHPVPFAPVPGLIKRFAIDITVYDLYGRRDGGDEDCVRRYKAAVSYLEKVASGSITLSTPAEPAPSSHPVKISSAPRVFSRDSLRGF
jgi:phage gp36-like protein